MSDLISDVAKPVLESSPGKSLINEVEKCTAQVAALTTAMKQLVQLMSVLDRKVTVAIEGNATCGVI